MYSIGGGGGGVSVCVGGGGDKQGKNHSTHHGDVSLLFRTPELYSLIIIERQTKPVVGKSVFCYSGFLVGSLLQIYMYYGVLFW